MQNKYVGDVGDFGKYGLLRTLFLYSNLILGVNWCLADIEEKNNDGKYLNYLNLDPLLPSPKLEKEYKPCDEELYRILQQIVAAEKRSVTEIEDRQILGEKTIFYRNLLGETKREVWHKEGLKALKKADVVFFDPDNGLEIDSCPKTRKNHVKYIYFDELADYYNRGQSLIVYNHRDHKPDKEYKKRFLGIKEWVKKDIGMSFLLRFSPYSVRDYFFVLQPEHVDTISQDVYDMLDYDDMGKFFNLVEE